MTYPQTHLRWAALSMATALSLAACGGSGGDDNGSSGNGLTAPTNARVAYGTKRYDLSWRPVAGATGYALYEDPDGAGPQPEVEVVRVSGGQTNALSFDLPSLLTRVNATYRLRACGASDCGAYSAAITPDLVRAIGYFKASNPEPRDYFGGAVVLSADGQTLAVSAWAERSFASGINGDETNNQLEQAGAVYVFRHRADGWRQEAYVKPNHPLSVPKPVTGDPVGMWFGASLALSADGGVLVVGAPNQSSTGLDISGQRVEDPTSPRKGAVYVFARQDGVWGQQALLKTDDKTPGSDWGRSVSLSADGRTLASCSRPEGTWPSYVNEGEVRPAPGFARGAAVIYRFDGQWIKEQQLTVPSTFAGATFCQQLSLSGDGNTLAANAAGIDNPVGADGNQVYPERLNTVIFTRSGGAWSQQASLAHFANNFALSYDGSTLVLGTAIRQNLPQIARSHAAAYVFTRNVNAWSGPELVQATSALFDVVGASVPDSSVAVSSDGNTLVMGSPMEASRATGLDGDPASVSEGDRGAAYLFKRQNGAWTQVRYIKPSKTELWGSFGLSLSLSGDGQTLAVGDPRESGTAAGVQGDQTAGGVPAGDSRPIGAVYLY